MTPSLSHDLLDGGFDSPLPLSEEHNMSWETLGARASRPHRAWTNRGYLPHFDSACAVQSITFRLADSLLPDVFAWLSAESDVEGRRRLEAMIDSGRGSCALRDPALARLVQNALLHFDRERYRLIAWVVMPNHVHVIAEQADGHPLADVVHSWKSFTAKKAVRRRGRRGGFWAPDYFDRLIRDEAHLAAAVRYVEENPVAAGLVAKAEDWPWSSRSVGLGGVASR